MEKEGILILALLLLIAGEGIFTYPPTSDAVHQTQSTSSIKGYQRQVKEADETAMNAMVARAGAFNKTLSNTLSTDPFQTGTVEPCLDDMERDNLLGVGGPMGYIDTPVIDVCLPVYHGTSAITLKKGVGHLYGSVLSMRGEGIHSAILAYRGLPSVKTFTDLDQIQMGNVFYFHILDRILAYQVDKAEVVEPTKLSSLDPVPGEEYMTLFTHTPYEINNHRLLVRDVRVPCEVTATEGTAESVDENAPELSAAVSPATMMIAVGTGIVMLATFIVLAFPAVTAVTRIWRCHRRKKRGRRR